jgi:predicted transposase YbfD/YdcC
MNEKRLKLKKSLASTAIKGCSSELETLAEKLEDDTIEVYHVETAMEAAQIYSRWRTG